METNKDFKHRILLKALVGSQAQGTSTPESDIDIKGIYTQTIDELVGFGYQEFVQVSKDETYYEIRRFIEMLMTANPNALELLFSPEDCILETSPEFKLLYDNRNKFLTKKCSGTFAGYAKTQIQKAKGLDKMMNWEQSRVERKTPIDFCFVTIEGKTMPLTKWLEITNRKQELCGLINLDHFKDCYAVYYSETGIEQFKGVIGEDSNELRLSSIPKGMFPVATVYYNKDGYSMHCKDYKNYQTWLKERNTNRYHTNKSHGQLYDSKNLSHCIRLIDIAIEIGKTGTFSVRRPNADYLLQIKRGDISLDQIILDAENAIVGLDELYKNSSLPDDVDFNFVEDLLIQIRKMSM